MIAKERIMGNHRPRLCLAALLVMTSLGCGRKIASYTPSVSVAEAAVRQALDEWAAGRPAGPIEGTKPLIQVNDSGPQRLKKLAGYRVLGETKGASGRTFAVTLQLSEPDAVVKTQYIVVGIDPLHVFRQEDYELLAHWDHHMPESTPPPDPTVSTRNDPK